VFTENATLLVSGLLLGSGCALVGIFPVLRQSANDLNLGSLAIALIGALLLGLGASAVAVALSSARITPSDLRRE
jgi:hypothetical protein